MAARIAFLGDTLLGGDAQPVLDRRGVAHPFRHLKGLLSEADLVVANHEGPITRSGERYAKSDTGRTRYWYRAHPESTAALVEAGVRVVSLANNHVLDFGLRGLEETRRALDEAGIRHCGAGAGEPAARAPVIVDVRGVRIGFLSYLERARMYSSDGLYARGERGGCAGLRPASVLEDLEALGGRADVRVVLAHWGRMYRRRLTLRQERLAEAVRAAGADLVVGHHPHVAQRVDLDGAPVLFSLGNGAFGTQGGFRRGRPPYGVLAFVDLEGARPVRIELRLLLVDNSVVEFAPRPVEGPEVMRRLWRLVRPEQGWTPIGERGLAVELT